ncbi:acyl-CoA desaturase [Providencia vermicola]|uniref:fatty acid desaturase family protein n=1 Tax=Providencia vermicola TaxID=333965 RepID=UPI0013A798B7|nr:acyl-CoA desaturase [Providencia vermicola]QIC15427.1 acyl-CoA desaturase [Providencia vermicola]
MDTPLSELHFKNNDEQRFHLALKQASNEYLKCKNDHVYASSMDICLVLGMFVIAIICYIPTLLTYSTFVYVIAYICFVLLIMLLNVLGQHDACHNTLFKTPWLNRIFGRLVTLPLGLEPEFWRARHVYFHHRYANIEHYDLDTEENGIFRQTPFQKWRPVMKYQYLYWPLIASFSLTWIAFVFDWSDRTGKTPLKSRGILTGWSGWLLFFTSKLAHLLLMLGLPLFIAHHNGISVMTILLTYLVSQMIASLFVVYLLLGTHWAETAFFEAPDNQQMPHGWYQHNFITACDWLPSPKYLWRLTGGLNYHLTHHLFPGWHHRNYPALAAIIEKLAKQHNMPYRCISYRQLLSAQIRFLRQMGKEPQ